MNYNKIRELVVDKRLSLRKLAMKVGMTQPGFMRMLKNESMTVETLERVAAALKVPISEFFEPGEANAVQVKEPEATYGNKTEVQLLANIDRNVEKIAQAVSNKK